NCARIWGSSTRKRLHILWSRTEWLREPTASSVHEFDQFSQKQVSRRSSGRNSHAQLLISKIAVQLGLWMPKRPMKHFMAPNPTSHTLLLLAQKHLCTFPRRRQRKWIFARKEKE